MKHLLAGIFILLAMNISAQQKFALVIGNGNYTSFGSLPNAVNDAMDMTATLQSIGFTVDQVLNGNRAQMVEGITRLKNRLSVSDNSYGFLFYAGHGVQFNGINYLIPATADIPNANYLGDTAISVQTMLAEINDAGNELNIIVLDACRDFPAAWSRSINRGLTVVANQPADSIIVYATSAGSTAADGTGRNGLFTGKLLQNLATPGLDVSEIFRRTGADVSQASNRQQIPAIYNQFFGLAVLDPLPVQPAPAAQTEPQIQPAPLVAALPPPAADTSNPAPQNNAPRNTEPTESVLPAARESAQSAVNTVQKNTERKFALGVQAGPQFTLINNLLGVKGNVAFYASVYSKYAFDIKNSLQMGVSLSLNNGYINTTPNDYNYVYKTTANFKMLNFPVLYVHTFYPAKNLLIIPNIGLLFSIAIGDVEYTDYYNYPDYPEDTYTHNEANKVPFTVNFYGGIGLGYKIGNGLITFNVDLFGGISSFTNSYHGVPVLLVGYEYWF
ncbi:MAG: caspase family protein [Treponema sp.]|nr:caspase family protein [Treponema sp.]